jgi:hypothetical protein
MCVCARSFVPDEQHCSRIEDATTAYSTVINGRQLSERETHFFPSRPLFRLDFCSLSFIVAECNLFSIVYVDVQLKSKICCFIPPFYRMATFVIFVLRISLDTRSHLFIDMLMMIVIVNSFPLSLFYVISITT